MIGSFLPRSPACLIDRSIASLPRQPSEKCLDVLCHGVLIVADSSDIDNASDGGILVHGGVAVADRQRLERTRTVDLEDCRLCLGDHRFDAGAGIGGEIAWPVLQLRLVLITVGLVFGGLMQGWRLALARRVQP